MKKLSLDINTRLYLGGLLAKENAQTTRLIAKQIFRIIDKLEISEKIQEEIKKIEKTEKKKINFKEHKEFEEEIEFEMSEIDLIIDFFKQLDSKKQFPLIKEFLCLWDKLEDILSKEKADEPKYDKADKPKK